MLSNDLLILIVNVNGKVRLVILFKKMLLPRINNKLHRLYFKVDKETNIVI